MKIAFLNRNNHWVHHLSKHPAGENAVIMKRKFNDVTASPRRLVCAQRAFFIVENVVTNERNRINIKMRTMPKGRKDEMMTKRNRYGAKW